MRAAQRVHLGDTSQISSVFYSRLTRLVLSTQESLMKFIHPPETHHCAPQDPEGRGGTKYTRRIKPAPHLTRLGRSVARLGLSDNASWKACKMRQETSPLHESRYSRADSLFLGRQKRKRIVTAVLVVVLPPSSLVSPSFQASVRPSIVGFVRSFGLSGGSRSRKSGDYYQVIS